MIDNAPDPQPTGDQTTLQLRSSKVETDAATAPTSLATDTHSPSLTLNNEDERGNIVAYIYAVDRDYVIYYGIEQSPRGIKFDRESGLNGPWWRRIRRSLYSRPVDGLTYGGGGVQVQLTDIPDKRRALQQLLLPLGTERAKLQALLRGWPRRESYDSSIASALQLALHSDGSIDGQYAALQTLRDAKDAILNEREVAGRVQYVALTLLLGLSGMLLLMVAHYYMFKGNDYLWLGAQGGLIGAILSIALSIRVRTVALNMNFGGNLADAAIRLSTGAIAGGAFVLFSTMLPLYDLRDVQTQFSLPLLLGLIVGFAERLVPSILDDRDHRVVTPTKLEAWQNIIDPEKPWPRKT
jgi:hypothetical protein